MSQATMKMNSFVSIAAATVFFQTLLATPPAFAETELTVSGEVRGREEGLIHIYSPADPTGNNEVEFGHMRSRIRLDGFYNHHVGAIVELQDVRVLGATGSTTADSEGLDVRRAMIALRDIGNLPIDVDVGRFVLFYGDQRLIGHLEWVDQGRTYDGVRVRLGEKEQNVDLFAVRIRDTTPGDDDQHFIGAYGHIETLFPGLTLEPYLLALQDGQSMAGETGTGTTLFATPGIRAVFKSGAFDSTVEAALQAGRFRGNDHIGFGTAVAAGITLEPATTRIGAVIAFATGDDDPTDGDSRTFQTLFPTNHFIYGIADLAAWSNLLSSRLVVTAVPLPGLKLQADYLHLRLHNPEGGWFNAAGALVRAGGPGASTHLGDEIDFMATWTPLDGLGLQCGYALFIDGGFIDDTGGGEDLAHFLYVQLSAKFSTVFRQE